MTENEQGIAISRQLSRRLLPLSIGIGLLIALMVPLTYWLLGHRDIQRHTTLYAEDLAEQFRRFAQEAPALWKYQTYKFIGLPEGFHPPIEVYGFRILDETGEPIAGYRYREGGIEHHGGLTFAQELRHTLGSAPIRFNNRQIGSVEVTASDVPLLRNTALIFALSASVGTTLALLVYRYPVRVTRRMEERLHRATAFSRTVMDSINDAVSIVDVDTFRILGGNAVFLNQLGLTEAQVMEKPCYELTHRLSAPCTPPDNPCPLRETVATGKHATAEHLHFLKDGTPVHVEVSTSPIFDERGRVVQVVHVSRDITERKQAQEILAEQARELEQLALYDELTGLYNRRGFLTLAGQQIRLADRFEKRMHLLFADLDEMKWINDHLGHGVGDLALQETAALLRATFREADIIARLGGDEFAVLALGGSDNGVAVITERFTEQLAARNRRAGRSYPLSVSIGVTKYDPAAPCSIEELLERGDALMYEQKRERKRALP